MQSHKTKVMVGFRDRLPSDYSSSSTPCHQPAELDFYRFSSALLPHSDQCQHDTTAVPPASPPCDRDDLTASLLSSPLRPCHRQLLHIPLSRKRTPCLRPQRKARQHVIQDNNIDIMLLTEIWLRPAGDEAKVADLAPPGYSVLSFPRSAGGSGAKGITAPLSTTTTTTTTTMVLCTVMWLTFSHFFFIFLFL